MKRITLPVCAALLLAAPALEAQQMREGVPPVLRPAPQAPLPDQQPLIDAFRKENTRMKRPRFVLLWDRNLSDEVVTYYMDFVAHTANSSASGDARSQYDSASAAGYGWSQHSANAYSSVDVGANSQHVVTSGTSRVNEDQARKTLSEIVNWKVEAGFKDTLLKGGTRLIDRNMIIRSQGADAAADAKVNRYGMETKAMEGKADMMVEVLLAPSPESPSGLAFRVNVVAVGTGEIVASLFANAMPPVREVQRYEADRHGYEAYVEQEGFSDQAVGKQLAVDTMKAVTRYWQTTSD